MKKYTEPKMELLFVGDADILTVSDPAMDDLLWEEL